MALNSSDLVSLKTKMRSHFKMRALDLWSGPDSHSLSEKLSSNLSLVLQGYECVAGYRALPSEPQLNSFFEACEASPHHRVVYPKVIGSDLEYFSAPEMARWVVGEHGVQEPVAEERATLAIDKIQAIVVPGLAFDRSLVRLGRGGGYYDRTLARSKALKIGVCAVVQMSESLLPKEDHDVVVDVLVTEKFILRLENRSEQFKKQ
jgi:5-formyltetrahydrofolate cyclo-ligase